RRRFAGCSKRPTEHAPHCLFHSSSPASFCHQGQYVAHRQHHSPAPRFLKASRVHSGREHALFLSTSRDKVFFHRQNLIGFAASRSRTAPSETPPSVPACRTENPQRSGSISPTVDNLVLACLADRLPFAILFSVSSEPPSLRLFRITFLYPFQSIN